MEGPVGDEPERDSRMNLSSQITRLAVIPLVGLVTVSGILFVGEVRAVLAARETKAGVEEALRLSDLVHAMQVERGQSAGYIASGGRNFVDTLPEVRVTTDAAIAALIGDVADIELRLEQIGEWRRGVDALSFKVPEMAKWYTGSIRMALHEESEALLSRPNPEVVRLGAGIKALTEAKEAAGLQRAAGATGLGSGAFADPVFRGFIARGAVEAQMLGVATTILGPVVEQFDFAAAAEEAGVAEIRRLIVEAGVGNAPDGITAPQWFGVSTAWIDFLREVEVKAAADIVAVANRDARSAWFWTTVGFLISAISIISTVVLGQSVKSNFQKALKGLVGFMNRLGRRDFEARESKEDLSSEIGELFESIDATRQALLEADTEATAAKSERVAVISSMQASLDRLAAGNLACEITDEFPEKYQSLKERFNAAVATLGTTMTGLNQSVASFEGSSSNLSSVTDDMSRRTTSQAASLEETTAALTEMAKGAAGAANLAKDTSAQTQSLREEAEDGREQIDKAIPVMEEISKAAEKMGSMVTLIDDIAFQTNLLALNAGVEAARAGDAGRGFAVVAGEVRSLAAKAGETASGIKDLIQKTNATIGSGVKMVGTAVEAFSRIDERVGTVTQSVEKLTGEARSQAQIVSEIQAAMESLDVVTQKNASMVEQCAEMAVTLGKQAGEVRSLAAVFGRHDEDEAPMQLSPDLRVA